MGKRSKKSFFYRHIAFYAVLVLIPVMIFIAFINNFLIRDLARQYNENTRQVLRQLVHYTETNLENIATIKDYLLQERQFPITREIKDVDKAQNIMHNLSKHTISNNFLSDMILYLEDDRYVYTSGSTYPVSSFISQYMQINPEREASFRELLQNPPEAAIFPLNRYSAKRNMVAVIYRLQLGNTKAALLFLFNPTVSQSLNQGEIFLALDKDNEPVFLKNVPEAQEKELLAEIGAKEPELLAREKKTAELYSSSFGEQYLLLSMDSEQLDWTYVFLSPISSSYSDLFRMQLSFALIVVFVLLLSIVLIRVGLKINYRPVSHLVGLAAKYSEESTAAKGEIELIQNALNYLATENISLRNIVVDNEKSKFVQNVLLGKLPAEQPAADKADLALPVFRKKHNAVHILAIKGRAFSNRQTLSREVLKIYEGLFEAYVLPLVEQNNCGILIGLDEAELADYEARCEELFQALQERFASDVLLCIGGLTEDRDEIARSYHEALLAYEYSFIKGKNALIRIDELEVFDHLDPTYPNQLFNRLSFALKSGAEDQALEALDALSAYTRETAISLYFAKGLCYQLIHTVSTVISELSHELILDEQDFDCMAALTDSPTLADIIDKVKKIAVTVCRRVAAAADNQEDAQGRAMVEYIDQNFMDTNFSVQNMADDFNMPLSSLSLFFKKQNKSTISSYLTTVRMNKAKELMLETTLPLNEITLKVGYLNPSSFIRKFKSLYGVTPGQWVKLNKDENEKN